MKPSRPLTHDLFKNFAEHYNIFIREVIIDKFMEGVFFAKLVCVQDGEESEIDARTSDAVALAIRFRCPIYTHESIMAEAGIVMDDKAKEMQDEAGEIFEEEEEEGVGEYTTSTLEELEQMLQKAVDSEEYEKASKIRDEINRRKKD